MVTAPELFAAVDAAFAVTGRGLAHWRDPHPDRSPRDDEYSRVSHPARWRIVGARAEAWLSALVDTGLAEIERDARVSWSVPPGTVVSRTDRIVPGVPGALPLVLARSQLAAIDDAGVTLGVGDPAVCVVWIPDCGCDACDSGSQDVLDELDAHVFGVVSGAYRRLWSGDREITVINGEQWRASGGFGRGEVAAILVRPEGWQEMSGASWMAGS